MAGTNRMKGVAEVNPAPILACSMYRADRMICFFIINVGLRRGSKFNYLKPVSYILNNLTKLNANRITHYQDISFACWLFILTACVSPFGLTACQLKLVSYKTFQPNLLKSNQLLRKYLLFTFFYFLSGLVVITILNHLE